MKSKTVQYNEARNKLIQAGWSFVGICNCASNIAKYRNGQYYIKIFRTAGTAVLYYRNNTITSHEPLESIDKLLERYEKETQVSKGASR